MSTLDRSRLTHYMPSLIAFLGVMFVLSFPKFIAFLVAAGLFAFGFFYFMIVYKLHKTTKVQSPSGGPGTWEAHWTEKSPDFKTVTHIMIKKF